jgi:carboxyl-terminal processing protease
MKAILIGLILLFLFVTPCVAQANSIDNQNSFDLAWKTVNQTYFDPTFGGIDWNAIRDRYHPQIVSSNGIEEFSRITNYMLFELRSSHLLVATEKMLKTYMPILFSEGTAGIDVRWMQNKVVITKVKPGFPAQKAGLKTGNEIKEIEGQDVNEIIRAAEALPPYNVRNRRGRISNFIIGHLNGPPDTSVSVRYIDENSLVKEAMIIRRSRGTGKIISDAMPPVFIEFEAKRLASDVGYIWFNHFTDPVDKDFIYALESMRDTSGLIVDVRSNPGGYFVSWIPLSNS